MWIVQHLFNVLAICNMHADWSPSIHMVLWVRKRHQCLVIDKRLCASFCEEGKKKCCLWVWNASAWHFFPLALAFSYSPVINLPICGMKDLSSRFIRYNNNKKKKTVWRCHVNRRNSRVFLIFFWEFSVRRTVVQRTVPVGRTVLQRTVPVTSPHCRSSHYLVFFVLTTTYLFSPFPRTFSSTLFLRDTLSWWHDMVRHRST